MMDSSASPEGSYIPPKLSINPVFVDEEVVCDFWACKKPQFSELSERLIEPFHCCCLKDFVHADQLTKYFDALRQELTSILLIERCNDLFQFLQSVDFANVSTPAITAIKEFFYVTVRDWFAKVTGFELDSYVALTASRYGYTDRLLCHDDELEERLIAFVLYLTPNWKQEDGGFLDVFDTDDNNNPVKVAKSLLPMENMLMFFEVAPNSYHQVSEVLATSTDKTRLSVHGWYHGKPRWQRCPSKACVQLYATKIIRPLEVEFDDFLSWISEPYLLPDVQKVIRDKFVANSAVELKQFLQPELAELLAKELHSSDLIWSWKGPFNRRNYYVLDTERSTCHKISECLRVFQSEAMYLVLSQLTGVQFHPLFNEEDEQAASSAASEAESHEPKPETKNKDSYAVAMSDQHAHSDKEGSESYEESAPAKKPKVEEGVSEEKEISSIANADLKCGCQCEVRKFEHGCYTMLSDFSESKRTDCPFMLNAHFYICSGEWPNDCGGKAHYVAENETVPLATVEPRRFSLILVYHDNETSYFVEYLNKLVENLKDATLYEINLTYYENVQ